MPMGLTYLTAKFKDKDKVKALGARFDGEEKRWYVPEGMDLAPFATWLPDDESSGLALQPARLRSLVGVDGDWGEERGELEIPQGSAGELAVPRKGMRLSQLLAGVAQAVSQAFKAGVWTTVEVVDVRLRTGGHVYIELSERSSEGVVLAKAGAMIWATTANRILPEFERATGAKLAPGIKLLVRAKPVFKPQYGFSIEIDAIDPDYTLGDLEAKKLEIRTRLKQEGLFDANRQLPHPWDYNAVLVVAPQGAAGLGDFQAEAERLERCGVCYFSYAVSRFQGEGAASEIRAALLEAMDAWGGKGAVAPDAVVIIRGGGAVNDLAWLNDYDLARCICELDVPVLTGIGHEKDSTVLDEVANQRFDTPSKVIQGIEQQILRRTRQAASFFDVVVAAASKDAANVRTALEAADAAVKSGAQRQVAVAAQRVDAYVAEVRFGASRTVRSAFDLCRDAITDVTSFARSQLSEAKSTLPALIGEVRAEARAGIREARVGAETSMLAVVERGGRELNRVKEDSVRTVRAVGEDAKRMLREASAGAEALIREIAGQGPEKTLGRGFAVVRDSQGQTVTTASQIIGERDIEIQFRDGTVPARARKTGD